MKIACPTCNASGTVPDHEVPESGRYFNCPRCNEGFTVTRPRAGSDVTLVDTCPACSFSTFGDEPFSTCPKCGIAVKSFIDRLREAQLLKHNQDLLVKKFNTSGADPRPPEVDSATVADYIDNLHPVNIIGWGVTVAAIIVLGIGLWGIIGYDTAKTRALLMENRDEQISELYVFLHFGLKHWATALYGSSALLVAILFMKRLKAGLVALSGLLRATIVLVPLLYIISFIYWVLAPIPHAISGYLIEIFNMVFMSALCGVPLYVLDSYLHERKIISVVKL